MTNYTHKQQIKFTQAFDAIQDGTLNAKTICGKADHFWWVDQVPGLCAVQPWTVLGNPGDVMSKMLSGTEVGWEDADHAILLELIDLSLFGDEGFAIQVLSIHGPPTPAWAL